MPNTANTCGGSAKLGGDLLGHVSHRADINRTEPERLRGDQRTLCSQRRIHHADDELLEIMRAVHLRLVLGCDAIEA